MSESILQQQHNLPDRGPAAPAAGCTWADAGHSTGELIQVHPMQSIPTTRQHAATPPVARPARVHPLGPLVRRTRMINPTRGRVAAAIVMLGCATPLVISARLAPDPAGIGTHRQLGYPACTLLVVTGYPCPTCGMTTAFAHTVRGQWTAAFHAQPMGMLLAIAAMTGLLASLSVLLSGRGWTINWYRIRPTRVVLLIVLLSAAAWSYKIVTVQPAANPGGASLIADDESASF